MASLEPVMLEIRADTTQFRKEMRKASRALKRVERPSRWLVAATLLNSIAIIVLGVIR